MGKLCCPLRALRLLGALVFLRTAMATIEIRQEARSQGLSCARS